MIIYITVSYYLVEAGKIRSDIMISIFSTGRRRNGEKKRLRIMGIFYGKELIILPSYYILIYLYLEDKQSLT
jgi:hypothetical protein